MHIQNKRLKYLKSQKRMTWIWKYTVKAKIVHKSGIKFFIK